MALEVVGGAFLSSFLNVLFERMAPTADFFKTRKMSTAQLDELETLLLQVNEVLDVAEHKQIASRNVKAWLLKLRDAAYDAVDLLDLIDYQAAATAKVEADRQTTGYKMWFTYGNPLEKALRDEKVPEKMEEIIGRLEPLVHKIGELGLRVGGRKDASSRREPTTSVIEESDIFGRDGDKKDILELLQQNDSDMAVIPLVGMGGIGKTTLAQLVYNDGQAIKLFERRAWVCVSENYDGLKIKREILKQVNHSKGDDGLTPTQIDEQLKKSLKGKKYLIVLDDMWNKSYADWDKLITPLKSGARGSKIIVTTRDENVASIMRTVPSSYQLRGLDPNDCWLLFVNHAFTAGIVIDQKLEAIGRKIVEKCKSLPLAAKMLGGLLRSERDVSKREEVLKSNIWDLPSDSTLPSLRLSYQHLPPYLKPCFAYCAIFPKDHKMDKKEIIHLWMAQWFLAQPVRGKKMEELGEECFDELVSRSFLQESRSMRGGTSFFLMHDLINDLARQIFGEFLARIEENDFCEIHAKTRHVSYMAYEIDCSKIHESISHVHVMQSLILQSMMYPANEEIVDGLVHNQISRFLSLRALSLCGFHGLTTLPDSIDNLKLLRYLNVGRTCLERLPESLCSLYNLQTLILYGCNKLVELPKNIGGLTNMHCLDIRNTPSLQELPGGIGNLKDLRILSKFIVGNQNGLDINELGKLEHLRGKLSILKLQNVLQLSEDLLQNKKYLEKLKLEWSSITEDSMIVRNILEQLQPHTSVKKISILGYGGTKFADWVVDSSYTNMVSLKLKGCKQCTSLPPLGQSPSLKYLSIIGFDAIVEVGAEFYGIEKTPFRRLETLKIRDMSQWERWILCEGKNSGKCKSLDKLERLTLSNCPKLKSIGTCEPTHKIFKSLNEWDVECCPNLRTSDLVAVSNFKRLRIGNQVCIEKLPSEMYMLKMWGYGYGNEKCLHRMAGNEEMQILFKALHLQEIDICSNHLLQSIPLEMFPKLQSLKLSNCEKLNSLSASEEPLQQPLTSLQFLEIHSNTPLQSIPLEMFPSLQSLRLSSHNSLLESIPLEMFPKLQSLSLSNFKKLKSLSELKESFQQPLTSLLSLEIRSCDSLTSFPRGGIPAPNLTHLTLNRCSNLRSLPERMHVLLPSLQRLKLFGCGLIESFPEGGLPADLQLLEIHFCDDLIGGRLQWGLQRLDALSHLRLGNYYRDDLDFFPEPTLLPFSLNSLVIADLKNLKYLNSEGLQHLDCLNYLGIYRCNNLQCLPEGLPSSLTELLVDCCDLLEGRCKPDTGEDWHKVSHISDRRIKTK